MHTAPVIEPATLDHYGTGSAAHWALIVTSAVSTRALERTGQIHRIRTEDFSVEHTADGRVMLVSLDGSGDLPARFVDDGAAIFLTLRECEDTTAQTVMPGLLVHRGRECGQIAGVDILRPAR
jgi:hypothetical protein